MNQLIHKVVDDEFAFLYEAFSLLRKPGTGNAAVWANEDVAVTVTFDEREFYPFVTISRVVDGQILNAPAEILPDSKLNSYDLDDVVALRAPHRVLPPHNPEQTWDEEYARHLVQHQAKSVRQYCSDILSGTFDVFADLEPIVKQRSRRAAFDKWGEEAALQLGWGSRERG